MTLGRSVCFVVPRLLYWLAIHLQLNSLLRISIIVRNANRLVFQCYFLFCKVALMAGIGDGSIDPICAVPLPVEPRKRFVFSFHCSEGPGLDCGLVTDCSQGSVYFRREGLSNNYVCGISPPAEMEPDHSNLDDIDYELFEEIIWPRLAHRVPAFEGLKLKSAWAGYYDYNFVDQNLIIGNHPYFTNFFFSNGSTGHGLQHSPAMGRAISEIINYQEYRTVNLDRFSFHRFTDEDSIPSEMNIF